MAGSLASRWQGPAIDISTNPCQDAHALEGPGREMAWCWPLRMERGPRACTPNSGEVSRTTVEAVCALASGFVKKTAGEGDAPAVPGAIRARCRSLALPFLHLPGHQTTEALLALVGQVRATVEQESGKLQATIEELASTLLMVIVSQVNRSPGRRLATERSWRAFRDNGTA